MKKILSLLLVGMMVVGMAACNNETTGDTTTDGDATTTVATTTRPPQTTPEPANPTGPQIEDWTLMEDAVDWHYKLFVCPYTDADGNPKTDAGGVFLEDTDEMKQWIDANGEEWYKSADVLADMATWPTQTAPMGDRADGLGDGNSPIGWAGDTHGIICYTTFELTAEQMEWVAAADVNSIYMNMFYDNAIYVYINGELVYSNDAGGQAGDWNETQEPVDFMDGVDIRTILKEGTNDIVVSVKDCWGGREFLMGLECVY